MKTELLLDGLVARGAAAGGFPEGPRWRDGKLWFSDMDTRQVMTVDLQGRAETIVHVRQRPSGLGWLPDGRLLIVSKEDRQVLVFDGNELRTFADLRSLASFFCNDMVTTPEGVSYVGNFGYDAFHEGDGQSSLELHTGELIRIEPSGYAQVAEEGLAFPNGSVITPDGRTLIVAETLGGRLSALPILPDGSLGPLRTWASFDDRGFQPPETNRVQPDGITLDAQGGIWVATPKPDGNVFRILEGGEITHRIELDTTAFACMLGGPQGDTLFILCKDEGPGTENKLTGQILTAQVDVPKAGYP